MRQIIPDEILNDFRYNKLLRLLILVSVFAINILSMKKAQIYEQTLIGQYSLFAINIIYLCYEVIWSYQYKKYGNKERK